MKHIDEYRDLELTKRLARELRDDMSGHEGQLRFMEVCGTHTMAMGRYGIRQMLPPNLELISGPGCPVCVTPVPEVDRALELAMKPGVILASFGDMMQVPGSSLSLGRARARGARAALVYSAWEAVRLAKNHPEDQVVFWGVGFETTSPTVAASLLMARDQGVKNFSVLASHKLLPPALSALLDSDSLDLQGFLLPGHVCAIIGAGVFQPLAGMRRMACVVGGFEPADILGAMLMMVKQCLASAPQIEIQYQRAVAFGGNPKALAIMNRVFEPVDSLWRGLGLIPKSELRLRPEFRDFDAADKFGLPPAQTLEAKDPPGCSCGQVLRGLMRPPQCPLFGTACTPDSPVGPCMVSSEGSCAAYYKYERTQ